MRYSDKLSTFIKTDVNGSDQTFGTGSLSINSIQATNLDSEDTLLLIYDGASIAGGTLKYKMFVPKGNGTDRGASFQYFGKKGITIEIGCRFKAVKASDGTTAPDVDLEICVTYIDIGE